ncbi:MAG: hypothetical protein NTW96_06510 [Planctomycetia bacterium]|nr:hypothetical protein [Planctomycetia bacterium]
MLFLLSIAMLAPLGPAWGQAESEPARQPSAATETPDPWRALAVVPRAIPAPLAEHPGNIHLEGEDVRVQLPEAMAGKAARWQARDDRGKIIAEGRLEVAGKAASGGVSLGRPGVGWYRIEFLDAAGKPAGWTSAAVLARLRAATPQDSPVCVDMATAWFARNDAADQRRLANLAALAGVNWVRDRLAWREIQPAADRFADEDTTYDSAATIQAEAGLKVLQVFHDTPGWAAESPEGRGRFPDDLRHAYRLARAMAQRLHGRVLAWEPWNEANAGTFGGHTVDEMCSYQKAACLGFKAGDPGLVVCWHPTTGTPTDLHTRGVLDNETWPYFDVYAMHSYDWPDSYAKLWGPVYAAACGRPLWITEADRGISTSTGMPWCDMSPEDELRKARLMAQEYASSLAAGANRHFHFILGHYQEQGGKVQFGLLRMDKTPRPTYVALAALGRLLAGGRCLGTWPIEGQPNAHVCAFSARPDGAERNVLVAWAEQPGDWPARDKTTAPWSLPEGVSVEAVFDYLGRSLGKDVPGELRGEPVFVLLRPGDARKLPLVPVPPSPYRSGEASPLVLQLKITDAPIVQADVGAWTLVFDRQLPAGREAEVTVWAYNFSDRAVRGVVELAECPAGWTMTPTRWEVAIEPMDRKALAARLSVPKPTPGADGSAWLRLRADFGPAGRPVLAFRVMSK